MKKIIVTVAATLFGAGVVCAQTFPAINVASDARTFAFGGTAGRDAASFLLEDKTMDAGLSYMSWSPSVVGTTVFNIDAFAGIGPVGIGVRYRNFGEQPYDLTNESGVTNGTFDPSESVIGINAAYVVGGKIAFGAGINSVSVKLGAEAQASAVAADVFVALHSNSLTAELSVNNLGGKLDFGGEEPQSLPSLIRVSGGYALNFGLNLQAEADYVLDGGLMAGAGAEYVLADIASIRAGYHFGNSMNVVQSYASLGAGVKFVGIALDFTYILASDTLGGSFMAGLRYSF